MAQANSQLESLSIYVIPNLRGAEVGFHWGLFIPTDKSLSELWHGTNDGEGWQLKVEQTRGFLSTIGLCLCFVIGTAKAERLQKLRDILRAVPGSGEPSRHGQEKFTCRVWVKDTLVALRDADPINSTREASDIEQVAINAAESNKILVEQGGQVLVMDVL